MSGEGILQLFGFLLPAVVTGVVAFYFFKLHTKNEDGRRRFLLHKDTQKNTLPIRLQAYERMALFLERISIASPCRPRGTKSLQIKMRTRHY